MDKKLSIKLDTDNMFHVYVEKLEHFPLCDGYGTISIYSTPYKNLDKKDVRLILAGLCNDDRRICTKCITKLYSHEKLKKMEKV